MKRPTPRAGVATRPALTPRARLASGYESPLSPSRPTTEGQGQLDGKTLQIAVIRLTLELTGGTASVDLGWGTEVHKARRSKWERAVASECSDWLGSCSEMPADGPQ